MSKSLGEGGGHYVKKINVINLDILYQSSVKLGGRYHNPLGGIPWNCGIPRLGSLGGVGSLGWIFWEWSLGRCGVHRLGSLGRCGILWDPLLQNYVFDPNDRSMHTPIFLKIMTSYFFTPSLFVYFEKEKHM